MPDPPIDVAGHCPMGCGEHLILFKGAVRCAHVDCPNPTFVGELLADAETEHIVEFTETGWTVLHPLRERGGDLFGCRINEDLRALDGPPGAAPGRYRATRHEPDGYSESYRPGDPGWDFERL